MPTYQIRVELHGARRSEQYTRLHTRMQQYGALVIIQGNNGLFYGLPPAEYRIEVSPKSTWDVCSDVAGVAATVTDPGDASPSIVVSQVTETAFRLRHIPTNN